MSRDHYKNYLDEEYITCPKCGGSGKDNATLDWKCDLCDGLRRVKKKDLEKHRYT